MTVDHDAKEAMRRIGPGASSGGGAPNGNNPIGAMKTVERIAQTIEDAGYADYTNLDPDRQAEYEDAWEDFKYWSQLMANVFSKDIAGQEDAMAVEVQTGTDAESNPVYESKSFSNPHGPSDVGVDSADLPDRPGGGL